MDYIKIPDLKDKQLYKIHARNANYGIWLADQQGFLIARHKFGEVFLFVEYHWDCEAFATARPLNLIEAAPFEAADFEEVEKVNKDGHKYRAHKKGLEILEYLEGFERKEL